MNDNGTFAYLPGVKHYRRLDPEKERQRQERMNRLLDLDPKKLTTGAKLFDYDEATEQHRQSEALRLYREAQQRHGSK